MNAHSRPQPPSSYTLSLGQPEDDRELRDLLAAIPMPGSISLCWHREPSYFGGAVVEGHFRQTIVVRDRCHGRVVGMGNRSVSPVYLNGQPAPVGYLGGLRSLPKYRGGTLLARGYRFLRQLHGDGKTALYVTTIARNNRVARDVLTSGRAGLPTYHPAGEFVTLLLPLRRRPRAARAAPIAIRPAATSDMPRLLEFWNTLGPRRQFFPVLTERDFGTPESLYRELEPSHILMACRDNCVCGTIAIWNQQAFRQTVVTSLPAWLRWLLPAYNLLAAVRRRPRLPEVGGKVSYLTAALPVVSHDDPEIWRHLLHAAQTYRSNRAHRFVALGLHASDPLLPVVRRRAVMTYITEVYLVCWEDGEPLRQLLDSRPIYLELGRL